jgi:hypothetical protein
MLTMSNDIRETVKELLDKVLDHLKGFLDGSEQSSEPELIPIPVRNDDEGKVYYHG